MSSFPTVATVIGISKEVAESGPLLATLAIDPNMMTVTAEPRPAETVDITTGDPVTQAVVDNIIGKLPTRKEPVMLKCTTCNITVSSEEILQTHYAGAKHARKVKGQELIKEISAWDGVQGSNPSFIAASDHNGTSSKMAEFTCTICNVRVNSYQQLQQHLNGTKHKNKAETNKSNTMSSMGETGMVSVDIGPNRLYCAACDVHVNSDLQLHQHITSIKHANKVNGRAASRINNRGSPYMRRGNRGGGNQVRANKPRYDNSTSGWNPSTEGLGLSGHWPQHTMAPNKSFVSGGILYNQ